MRMMGKDGFIFDTDEMEILYSSDWRHSWDYEDDPLYCASYKYHILLHKQHGPFMLRERVIFDTKRYGFLFCKQKIVLDNYKHGGWPYPLLEKVSWSYAFNFLEDRGESELANKLQESMKNGS